MLIFMLLDYERIFPDFQGRYMEVQQKYSTCELSSYSNGNGSNDSMIKQKAFFNTNRFFTFILHNSVYIQERPQLTSPVMLICVIFTVYKWGVCHA